MTKKELELYRKCTKRCNNRTRYNYEIEHEYDNEINENDYIR